MSHHSVGYDGVLPTDKGTGYSLKSVRVSGDPHSIVATPFEMSVPASPAKIRGMSSRAPIAAVFPVRSANPRAASTFGLIEPDAKSSFPIAAGEARRIAFADGVPHPTETAGTSVAM